MIEQANYTQTGEIVAIIDELTMTIPDDMGNRHRQMLVDWVAAGHTIGAYVPPAVNLYAYAADRRWKYEIGGTTWNGWMVPTDDRSQAKYMSELLAVQTGVRSDGDYWKFPHGFESLTNAQMSAMATAVRGWILQCFEAEGQIDALIYSGHIYDTAGLDSAMTTALGPLSA